MYSFIKSLNIMIILIILMNTLQYSCYIFYVGYDGFMLIFYLDFYMNSTDH